MAWLEGLGGLLSGLTGSSGSDSSVKETYDITDATKGTTNVTKGTDATNAGINDLLAGLLNKFNQGSEQYSRSAAIADSSAVADAASQQVLDQIGGILKNQAGGGAYSSTETGRQVQASANKAAQAKAQVTLDTISKYASLQQADEQQTLQGLLSVISLGQAANTSQTIDQTTKKSGTTTKEGDQGGSVGYNGSGILAGLKGFFA